MRQRFYDPDIKRIINQDILIGDITSSQSLNRYAYVQGNPVNYNDPFGLNPRDAIHTAMNILHAELNILSIVLGVFGATAGFLNTCLYLSEGNNEKALECALGAAACFIGGKILTGSVGLFCKTSTAKQIAFSVILIGVGEYQTVDSAVKLSEGIDTYKELKSEGVDAATLFTAFSENVRYASGIFYGVTSVAGGVSGITSQCFVEGTIVKTEDGDKNIEDIEEGDKIWFSNPDTGETGLKEVKQVFVNETDELQHITLRKTDSSKEEINHSNNSAKTEEDNKAYNTDKEENNSIRIDCIPKHPFYVVNYGFKYASELLVGDKIISLSGDIYEIVSNEYEHLNLPVKVYNFEVEDWHTYFVTQDGLLVHNICAQKGKDTIPSKSHKQTEGEGGVSM